MTLADKVALPLGVLAITGVLPAVLHLALYTVFGEILYDIVWYGLGIAAIGLAAYLIRWLCRG